MKISPESLIQFLSLLIIKRYREIMNTFAIVSHIANV